MSKICVLFLNFYSHYIHLVDVLVQSNLRHVHSTSTGTFSVYLRHAMIIM